MTRVVDRETGQEVEVDELEAQAGFQAGRYGLVGDRVNLVDKDGEFFNVDPSEAQDAFAGGARLASNDEVEAEIRREEAGSGLQRVAAGAEAVGRGLTLGALTPLEVAAGVDPEGIKARREAAPESTALEVLGAAAPTLMTGGAGALGLGARGAGAVARAGQAARVAGALPRATAALGRAVEAGTAGALRGVLGEGAAAGIAGRALGAGLAGAAEGAAVGAGQVISEASLGDADLTAEQIWSGAARGAVFGGVTAGVLTGTATATGKAFKAAARKVLNAENVEKLANKAAFKQFGPLQGHVKKAMRKFGDDPSATIGSVVRDEGIDVFGKSPQEIAEIAAARKQHWGQTIGDSVGALDDVVDDTLKPQLKTIASRLRKEVIAPLKKSSSRTARRLGKRVEEELSSFDPLAPTGKPGAARGVGGRPARGVGRAAQAQDDAGYLLTGRSTRPEEAGMGSILGGGAGAGVRRARRAAGDLGPLMTGKAPRQLGFRDLHRMRRELDVVAYPQKAANAISPNPTPFQAELQKARAIVEDEFTRAADAASDSVGDAVSATYRDAKKKYAVFTLLDEIAKKNVEREVANRAISLTDTIAGAGGMSSGAIVGLLAGDVSVLGGLAVGAVTGVGAGLVNKFVREQGQRLAAGAGSKLLALAKSRDAFVSRISQASERFFGPKVTRGAIPMAAATGAMSSEDARLSRRDRFDKRIAQLEKSLHTEPDMLGMEDDAPQVAEAMKQTMSRAQGFLAGKVPTMPRLEGVKPSSELVSPADQSRFLRFARTADDFGTFVDDVGAGSVTPDAVEAAKAVYPKAFGSLQKSLEAKLSKEGSAKLSPAKRVQLSLVLGRPVHFTMTPEFIAATQAAIASDDKPRDGAVSPSRRSKPDIASVETTKTDAMESA